MSTLNPLSGRPPINAGRAHRRTGLSQWAVGLGAAVAATLGVSYAIFGATWALWGEDAISDTFAGQLAGFALIAGLATSLVAFVVAIVAGVRNRRWAPLWLPLGLFPALLVIVTLVEVFWME